MSKVKITMKNLKIIILSLLVFQPIMAFACSSSLDNAVESYLLVLKLVILILLLLTTISYTLQKSNKKKNLRIYYRIFRDILIISISLFVIFSIWINLEKKKNIQYYEKERLQCEQNCEDSKPCFCNPICN